MMKMVEYIIFDMKGLNTKDLIVCSGSVNKKMTLNKYSTELYGEITLIDSEGKCHAIYGDEIEDYEILNNELYVYLD